MGPGAPDPATAASISSPRASSHSSNTLAWSSVAGKSVRTNPASGLREKNQRRRSAIVEASSPSAEPGGREIPRRASLAGETCSICKERARSTISSPRKSIEPSRRSFVRAGAPNREKGSIIPSIRTLVKSKRGPSMAPPAHRPGDDPEQEDRPEREAELDHGLHVQGVAHGARPPAADAAGVDAAPIQEPVVMALQKEGLDLAHRVQDHAHRDQHPRAAEEVGDPHGHVELEEEH